MELRKQSGWGKIFMTIFMKIFMEVFMFMLMEMFVEISKLFPFQICSRICSQQQRPQVSL